MSSAAVKALGRRRKAEAAGGTPTSAVGFGKIATWNMGVGYRRSASGAEPWPLGMPMLNPQQLAFGYGHGQSLRADGKAEGWGQNSDGMLPWKTGPIDGYWSGPWEYRTGLKSQTELAASAKVTIAQVEAKERALEITERFDGRKALLGQVAFKKDMVVSFEGQYWKALKESVGIEPGTDGTAWALDAIQPPQFLIETRDGRHIWTPVSFNLQLPMLMPQLTDVIALVAIGSHSGALHADGSLTMEGRILRYSAGGNDVNLSYGPPERPKQPPTRKTNPFQGTLTSGSKWITALGGVAIRHHREKGETITASFGQVTRKNSLILMPEGGPAGVLPAGVEVVAYEAEELFDEKGKPFSPAQERLLRVELSAAATGNYTGQLLVKKPPKEQKFWPAQQSAFTPASWPVKVKLPEGVKAAAFAMGASGQYRFSAALAPTGTASFNGHTVPVGKVLAWGSNATGNIGNGVNMSQEKFAGLPVYVRNPTNTGDLENVVAITCGDTFDLALTADHKIYIWGSVDKGVGGATLDEEQENRVNLPHLIPNIPTAEGERPVAVCGGEKTAYAILENGHVIAWGRNQLGECGNGEIGGKPNGNWKSGHVYTAGQKVYDKGGNWECILGLTSTTHPESDATHWKLEGRPNRPIPVRVGTIEGAVYIAAGSNNLGVVTSTGKLWTVGSNQYGQIGNGLSEKDDKSGPVATPHEVDLEGRKALSCEVSEFNTFAILEGSEVLPGHFPVSVKLVPAGEIGGEQSARLRLDVPTALGTSGWVFRYRRAKNILEEDELEILILELEAEIAEALEEGTAEEIAELEEELVLAEAALEEQHETSSTGTPTITVPSAGHVRFEWTPPAPLTPNFNFLVSLSRTSGEPASFRGITLFTSGLWPSPYAFV